jgi:hypothetical protein
LAARAQGPRQRAERLIELADRLARVMEPSYIPVWISRPLAALDDDKALERLARGPGSRPADRRARYPGVS